MPSIKIALRDFIKRHPMVYFPVKRLMDRDITYRLAGKNSDFCLEGYPSSGNSFLYTVLMHLKGDLEIASHSHSVANIKAALARGLPSVVVIRQPVDAIASRIARFGGGVDGCIAEYLSFYGYVESQRQRLLLLPFAMVTSDTRTAVERIVAATGIVLPLERLDQACRDAKERMRSFAEERGRAAKVSLPSAERDRQKQALRQAIEAHPRLPDALALWQRLDDEAMVVAAGVTGPSAATKAAAG